MSVDYNNKSLFLAHITNLLQVSSNSALLASLQCPDRQNSFSLKYYQREIRDYDKVHVGS